MIEVQRLSISDGPRWFTDSCGEWIHREWRESRSEISNTLRSQRHNFSIYAGDFENPFKPKLVFAGDSTMIAQNMGLSWSRAPAIQTRRPMTVSGSLADNRQLSVGYFESVENHEPQFHAVSTVIHFDDGSSRRLEYCRAIFPFRTLLGAVFPVMFSRPLRRHNRALIN